MYLALKYSIVLLCGATSLSSCGRGSKDIDPEPLLPTAFGFHIVDWSSEDSFLEEAKKAITELEQAGVRAVSLVTYRFVNPETGRISVTSAFGLRSPPSDRVIIELSSYAKDLGFKVMISPLIEVDNKEGIGRVWRGDYSPIPSHLNGFLEDYRAYLDEMARIAETSSVELLCVGSELKSLMQNKEFSIFLSDIALELRRRNPDTMVFYASHFSDYELLSIWDSTDFIGINLYESLSSSNEASGQGRPSVQSLENAIRRTMNRLRSFSLQVGKPIVLSEWGFVPFDLTTVQPWSWQPSFEPDSQEQKDAILSMFEASKDRGSWLHSVWLWHLALPGNAGSSYAVKLDSVVGLDLLGRISSLR